MKRGTKRLLAAALLGAAAIASPATTDAGQLTTTLDTLLPGGSSITLGDKRYSNFTFSSDDETLLPSNVDVTLSNDASGNQYTLRFGFDALVPTNPRGSTDVVICYQVDVQGNQLINGVGLTFASVANPGNGQAAASVSEIVSTIDPDGAGPLEAPPVAPGSLSPNLILDVFNDGAGGLPEVPGVTQAVIPTRSLVFCKDIIVSARDGGTVNITTVDNIVNQVPEPASLGLFAAGGASLLLRRRRR